MIFNLLYNGVYNFSICFLHFSIDNRGKEGYNTIKPTNDVGLQGIWRDEIVPGRVPAEGGTFL